MRLYKNLIMTIVAATAATMSCHSANTQTDNMTKVKFETTDGDIVVALYDDTPGHRDNFVKLVDEGFYDGLLFHRVIRDFMVQTGDPESRNAAKGAQLGNGNVGYEIDAEILFPAHINKRGVLAAARYPDQMNPLFRSSGSQFYIVTGRTFTDAELDRMEERSRQGRMQGIFNRLAEARADSIQALQAKGDRDGLETLRQELIKQTKAEAKAMPGYSEAQRETYRTQGGAPHLDGCYTVFGEVIEGMDTVDKIQTAATDPQDRPLDDIRIIKATVVK